MPVILVTFVALSHTKLRDHIHASLRSRRLKVVGTRKNGAREKETREGRGSFLTLPRVSLARARSPFRPLLPSGISTPKIIVTTELQNALNPQMLFCKTLKQTNKQQQSNKPTAATNNIAEEVTCVCYWLQHWKG